MSKENKFEWWRLGDIAEGRENLGPEMPVILYRLMQYTISDVICETIGDAQAEEITRRAGFRAGVAMAENMLDLTLDFDAFISQLQKTMKDMKIGVLKIERADLEKLQITLTIDEDLDCSGLPVLGETVCIYDEGFIAGILEAYTKKEFSVKEIDCWATGGRTCRFDVRGNV